MLISEIKYEHSWVEISGGKVWESNEIKRLGVAAKNKLKFDSYIVNIRFKVNQKLSVLSRLEGLLNFDKKQLFKAIFSLDVL